MPNDIFTADELDADKTGAEGEQQAAEQVEREAAEQAQAQRERDEQGRFKAKEPDEGDAGEGAPEGDDGKNNTVPQGALHAERERRKAAEERERAKDSELAAAREQLAAIAKMREQIAARKPEELPAADDPAAVEHLRKRLEEQGQQLNRLGQQQDMQAVQTREYQELGAVITASDAKFREVQPDYDDAITHLVNARAQELAEYNLPPAQIQATIAEEALDIVRTAVSLGRDPAEMGYKIAISRGYRPQQGEQQQQGNGKALDKLQAIATAQAGSKSLGQASGGTTAAQLNAEAIAALSGEEFERLYMTPEGRALIDAL